MARKSDVMVFDPVSETGNWNVAQDFVKLKVMKPLYEIGQYATKAVFGVDEMEQAFGVAEETIVHLRIEAIKHMHHRLTMLINDTVFAIKKPKDLEKMKDILTTLKSLLPFIHGMKRTIVNQRDNTRLITINEFLFDMVLMLLNQLRSDVLTPLNNSDLIFTSSDEIDPDEMLRKIQEDIIHGG